MKSSSDIPNEEAVAEEIEKMLVEAWEKLKGYYKEKAPKYRESWRPKLKKEKDAKDSHWICWDEHDLMFHIGRFFYDILKEKKESLFSNIEVHFEKKVDRVNFSGYVFEKKLDELKAKLGMKGYPKVDMIVAKENSNASLLLCAEAKYFRYSTDWKKAIKDDIEKLIAYRNKKFGITKRAVFMLFDDYYWYKRGGKTMKKIEDELEKIEKEKNGITVLYYKSKAKMCGFRPDC